MSLTRCIRSDLRMVIRHSYWPSALSGPGNRAYSDRVSNVPNESRLSDSDTDSGPDSAHRPKPIKKLIEKPIGDFDNCVLVSRSRNIFENLAIEDWLYRHQNFDNTQLLLLWRNAPCVVIGRHQNPWQEIQLAQCRLSNVAVARRNSGGGTVYHDLNNLNICFFASKRAYNRKQNLELIRHTIRKHFQIDLNINPKEDLLLDENKVSGTASKLAYNKSYHHCTLLVRSDLNNLSKFIRKGSDYIVSNATKSVYSPVKNLSAVNGDIEIEKVIDALADSYKQTYNSSVRYVDFDEATFPTIGQLKDDLQHWNWVFGKTPKFKIINSDLLNDTEYRCELSIAKGLVEKVELFRQNVRLECVLSSIVGKRLVLEEFESAVDEWLLSKSDFQSIYLSKLVLDTIRAVIW